MNAQQEETVEVLRGLIGTCRNGQEGFRTASECVAEDPELKMLLSSFSLQRAKFAGELEAELIGMGEHHPEEEEGSVAGATHRGWIQFKAAMTRADNHAILAECERGEDSAVEAYKKAMRHELPDPVREIVQRQQQEVLAAHNTIRALRDATPSPLGSAAKSARETIRNKGGQAAESATEIWQEMRSKAGNFRKSTELYIRRNPLPSLGWALLAGFSIGMAVYAVELRNERTRLEVQRRPLRKAGAALAAWLGILGSRARSGYKESVETIQDKVETITGNVPKFRRNRRFARPFKAAWRRMSFR